MVPMLAYLEHENEGKSLMPNIQYHYYGNCSGVQKNRELSNGAVE